jgi:hypothetical protein
MSPSGQTRSVEGDIVFLFVYPFLNPITVRVLIRDGNQLFLSIHLMVNQINFHMV